ncbi:hypothetical protein M8J76_002038 [Diaphorina citri]|nr:hypothetical protein M8J75_012396 [Diaphorina citri]KAI5721986.1 hypothetical protein M8J76_002038 [Diaphorina citri]KAI5724930.1 hypothetical protein M8J77_008926 [Diaphorina citri]
MLKKQSSHINPNPARGSLLRNQNSSRVLEISEWQSKTNELLLLKETLTHKIAMRDRCIEKMNVAQSALEAELRMREREAQTERERREEAEKISALLQAEVQEKTALISRYQERHRSLTRRTQHIESLLTRLSQHLDPLASALELRRKLGPEEAHEALRTRMKRVRKLAAKIEAENSAMKKQVKKCAGSRRRKRHEGSKGR